MIPRERAASFGLGVGAVTTFAVLLALMLWLVNLDGPFGERRAPGLALATTGGLLAGVVVGLGVHRVALRSRWALAGVLALLATLTVVLFPRSIDVGESFAPRPNPRWSCTGWEFTHYPVGVMDASSTAYCVGLEERIADG